MDQTHKNARRTQNRGVNITLDELEESEHNYSEATNTSFPSLYNMKNQLQNAIDVMGPGTPHLMYTSSIDADNEESVISSIFSSVVQITQQGKTRDQGVSARDYESPRDISEAISNPESELVTLVHDFPQEKQSQPICVQAVLPPAVLCMNPGCVCTHAATVFNHQMPIQHSYEEHKVDKKHKVSSLFGKFSKTQKKRDTRDTKDTSAELYKMNIMQARKDGSPPRRFVFDLIDEVPKPTVNTVGTNTKYFCNTNNHPNEQTKSTAKKGKYKCKSINATYPSHYSGIVVTHNSPSENCVLQDKVYYDNLDLRSKMSYKNEQNMARVDVYYFDHGNAAYYKTTDSPPLIMTELVAEKTENYATKFWAELFGTVYIAFAFFTSFILQLSRFTLHSLLRPLTIGLLQLISDYFFKPFLAVIFNAVIQPPLIFIYNIATSLRDLCDPLAEGCGYYLREVAMLCRSIRLFEIRHERCDKEQNVNVKSACESNSCKQNCKCDVT